MKIQNVKCDLCESHDIYSRGLCRSCYTKERYAALQSSETWFRKVVECVSCGSTDIRTGELCRKCEYVVRRPKLLETAKERGVNLDDIYIRGLLRMAGIKKPTGDEILRKREEIKLLREQREKNAIAKVLRKIKTALYEPGPDSEPVMVPCLACGELRPHSKPCKHCTKSDLNRAAS